MYKKLTAAIAATIMITAMFASFATTAAQPAESISPSKAGGGQWTLITLEVKNDFTGTSSEIKRIRIVDEEEDWSDPMGGHAARHRIAENWENVADNLAGAAGDLNYVADNLSSAQTNLNDSGFDFEYAAENLDDAGGYLNDSDNIEAKKAGYAIGKASDDLKEAAYLLQSEPQYLDRIAAWIENATGSRNGVQLSSENFQAAADNLTGIAAHTGGATGNLISAGGAIENALGVNNWLDNAADNIRQGVFRTAASCIENAAENIKIAGTRLDSAGSSLSDLDMADAGELLKNEVYTNLTNMSSTLNKMAENINNAGTALGNIRSNYFANAKTLAMDNEWDNVIDYLGSTFVTEIGNAEDALLVIFAQELKTFA
ncbi:hypothetical protein AKJ53_00180 [candidate division MSBL1 archaeon SCGC-AAA382F02]|uniref:Uncharacterized protein n=1 Tax=candidate division MSBL1 archaeon SCGC-AAA382F02 TaxID=1698282 RepID=A0A133VJ34_9EURY|nr:hypothetical protein AKJ53_00180 [candidate division MSBL1 archaeon SCGC-AAA382F02]